MLILPWIYHRVYAMRCEVLHAQAVLHSLTILHCRAVLHPWTHMTTPLTLHDVNQSRIHVRVNHDAGLGRRRPVGLRVRIKLLLHPQLLRKL